MTSNLSDCVEIFFKSKEGNWVKTSLVNQPSGMFASSEMAAATKFIRGISQYPFKFHKDEGAKKAHRYKKEKEYQRRIITLNDRGSVNVFEC